MKATTKFLELVQNDFGIYHYVHQWCGMLRGQDFSCNTFSQETQKCYVLLRIFCWKFFLCSTQKIDGNLLILKNVFFHFFPILAETVKNSNYIISLSSRPAVFCLLYVSSDFQTAGLSQPYFTPIIFLHDLRAIWNDFPLHSIHMFTVKKLENGEKSDEENQSTVIVLTSDK